MLRDWQDGVPPLPRSDSLSDSPERPLSAAAVLRDELLN
jgi:hypothetical protein